MDATKLELYWSEIPVGKENAVSYPQLISLWGRKERDVRKIMHELSLFDNGDDYVLIRSGKTKGFYKTDDPDELEAYKRECLCKGKSIFAPVKKINRVLNANMYQVTIENNLRLARTEKGMKQEEVCKRMREIDDSFDAPLLSKMENGVCLPTPIQLAMLAQIYACNAGDLVKADLFSAPY